MTRPARMFLMANRDKRREDTRHDIRDRYDVQDRYEPRDRYEPIDRYEPMERYEPRERYDTQYRYNGGSERMNERGFDDMDRIGFRMHESPYVGDRPREKRSREHGYAAASEGLDRETAERWMRELKNADGSRGAHWTFDQTQRLMQMKGLQHDPTEFWAAMNATYSDLCGAAAKLGMDNDDFYIEIACALWFHDKDAVHNKLAAYYKNIVKH